MHKVKVTNSLEKKLMETVSLKAMIRYEEYKEWIYEIMKEKEQAKFLN